MCNRLVSQRDEARIFLGGDFLIRRGIGADFSMRRVRGHGLDTDWTRMARIFYWNADITDLADWTDFLIRFANLCFLRD
jgi:hypothetical protein